MSELFTQTAIIATIAAALRLAMPLLLAGLGEMYGQRSGILNLGVEGVMLLGGFFAYWTVLELGSPWLGLLVGLVIGFIMGLLNGVISVTLKADQGISGIGVFLFGLGMSDLLFQKIVGTPRLIDPLSKVEIPLLESIPVVGEAAFTQRSIVYLAFLLVPLSMWVLNKTTFGLNIRAVGENPAAADSLGVSVARTRYMTLIIGGVLAGAAGAGIVLTTGTFQQNFTAGKGFIAIALVYFGAWRPIGVMLGALLFGFVEALVTQLKTLELIPVSSQDLANMAPALITVLALVVVSQRFKPPAALTKPFSRGG